MMKLINAGVHHTDGEIILQTLSEVDFRTSRIASSGYFVRKDNTSLSVGKETDRVPFSLQIPHNHGRRQVNPLWKQSMVFVLPAGRLGKI